MLTEGLTHTSAIVVTDEKTALSMGSGNLPVFATPAMAALMENAAMLAVAAHLPDGSTTVGGSLNIQHIKPSGVGAEIHATAVLTAVSGRKLLFDVTAHDANGIIGKGTHERFVVECERFIAGLKR
ncbi:MAG: thioesterase family protein [Bacteroidaceae bacterium]|nr:thioesterase family protein [Bacteroidaceae bacterium]MBQ6694935.1 thioesterase family protein [Bacteroidaceae bacterium]